MKVSKIKKDAQDVLGYCTDATLYNRLTQAVEVLANEGQWDSMQAYMDIRVDSNGVVTLPRDVEAPIKININDQAAFSKDKLFEFSLNGPGTDMAETSGWAWMDRGRTPVSIQPQNENLAAIAYHQSDVGKKLQVWGTNHLGREVHETLTLQPPIFDPPPATSHFFYDRISRVEKDPTVGVVGLFADPIIEPPPGEPPPGPPPPPPPPPPPEVRVEIPVLTPASGTYPGPNGALGILVTDRTVGSSLIYTTDGSEPTRNHGRHIARNIMRITMRLPSNQTEGDVILKVIGIKDGMLDSHVATGNYHIIPPPAPPEGADVNDFSDQAPPEDTARYPSPDLPDPLPPEPGVHVFNMISLYYPDELEPSYRQIKLSKNARVIRMLYRKRSIEITSDEDWIPLDSTMAILTMLKALEAIRNGSAEELQKVDALYKNAVMFLEKEQASRMQFAADASKEIPPSLNASYGIPIGQTGLTVRDIKVDARNILGNCEDSTLYNRLTHAIEALANEAQWDSLQAYMDIIVSPDGIITLPRDVETPLKININGNPAFSHNKLYEFTLNGPGNDMAETSGWAWMDKGRSPVGRQPSNEKIAAICYNAGDIGKKITIWGRDHSNRSVKEVLEFQIVNNVPEPGYQTSVHFFDNIDRVEKEPTRGYTSLLADPMQSEPPPPPPPPPPPGQVEDAVLDPVSGTYPRNGGAIVVRATTRTEGATFRYTVDGSEPTHTHGYRSGRNIVQVTLRLPLGQTEGDVTFKVLGIKEGLLDSHVVTGQYHILPAPAPQEGEDEFVTYDELQPNTKAILPEVEIPEPVPPVPEPPVPNVHVYNIIALYHPDELAPSYRQIKLTKNATAVRMLYRRKTMKITSDDDWIPLDSSMALLTMLKALEAIRIGTPDELQKVDALYKNAVMLLQKEQDSRMAFAIEAQKEVPPNLAITYGLSKGQSGLIAADLKPDARQILGNCEDTTFYNRLTHAIEVLSNEGQWDSLQSYVDIPVLDTSGIITLPRDVDMPIKVNINNNPSFSRSKLYEFTLNGPGASMLEADWSWVDRGETPVGLQPKNEKLVAMCENLQDVGKHITVYGYDNFDRECSDVLTISPFNQMPPPVKSRHFYSRITRVLKEETVGQVGLFSSPTAPEPPPPPPPPPNTLPGPAFDPIPGTYPRPQGGSLSVRVSVPVAGSYLSYTLDGSTPSRGHGTIIPRQIALVRIPGPPIPDTERFVTLKAMAFKDGAQDSPVTSGVYHITVSGISTISDLDPVPTTADTEQFLFDQQDDALVGAPEDRPAPVPGPQPEVGQETFVILAIYYPDETMPLYRQIRVNAAPETPTSVRILYRRRTYVITSDADWIPLNSRMAILTMMRALEALRIGTPDELQKAELYRKQAIQFIQAEQKTKENFDLAVKSESPSAAGLGIYNLDSLIANDVYDDGCQIFGPIGYRGILDKISTAMELLANLGQWDGMHGYVDLITDNHYFITLPRYIENVISLNIDGHPKMFRNKWFEFHLNGPGTGMPACDYWDDVGDVVTIRPVQGVFQPVAYADLASDRNRVLIIYGLDEAGRPVRRMQQGQWYDGYALRVSPRGRPPDRDVQKFSRIDRILKQPSDGFIQLWAYERTFSTTDAPAPPPEPAHRSTPLGFYYPDETEPTYRRIKLPRKAAWVRMRYRKRNMKVTSLGDPLHLKNRLAVVTAMRAVKALETDPNAAAAWEKKAEEYLSAEQSSRNPSETFTLQVEGLDAPPLII